MCVKSRRHLCLQTFLIIVLILCMLLFALIAKFDIGIYLLSASATVLQSNTPLSSPPPQLVASETSPPVLISATDVETNLTAIAETLVAGTDGDNDEDQPLADQIANHVLKSNCSLVLWTIHSGYTLDLCPNEPDRSNPSEYVQCFRKSNDACNQT